MSIINIKCPKSWSLRQEVIKGSLDSVEGTTNSQTTHDKPHSFSAPLRNDCIVIHVLHNIHFYYVPLPCQQMAFITNATCQTRIMQTLKGDMRQQTKQSLMKVDLCQWVEVNSFALPLGLQASFKPMVLQGRKELGNVVLLHCVCAYRNWSCPVPSLAVHNNWARSKHVNQWSILDLTVIQNTNHTGIDTWFDLLSQKTENRLHTTKYSLYSRQLADSTEVYNQVGEEGDLLLTS